MNSPLKILFVSLAALLAINLVSVSHCQVLSFKELDRDGDVHEVDFNRLIFPIVDINSTLRIAINKEAIRQRASQIRPMVQPVSSEELEMIAGILGEQSRLLAILGPCTGTPEQCSESLRSFSRQMSALLTFVQRQKILATQVDSILGLDLAEPGMEYAMVFDVVRSEVGRMTRAIGAATPGQRVYFSLGGWLREQSGVLRPIHIPQFDNYAEGEFYEVPRFVMPTPEELREQYAAAAEAAREYNTRGFEAVEGLRSRVMALRDSVRASLLCVQGAVTEAVDLTAEGTAIRRDLQPFLEQLGALIKKVNELEELLRGIRNAPNALRAALASFKQIRSLLQDLHGHVGVLVDTARVVIPRIRQVIPSAVRARGELLLSQIDGCTGSMESVRNDITLLVEALKNWINLGVPQQVEINLDLGEQVKRFLIEDVPDSTDVDLRYTGQRSGGDEMYFKAALEERTDSLSAPQRTTELERRGLTMYQVSWHAKLSVGVVFLDPFGKGNARIARQFQAAPSYTVLLKWGSRSSYAYNKFWSVGIGLNLAAPDFDLDSTPEMGIGITASTAMDYVQCGIGRNLGVDSWYWFFGLRLPVGTITTPGVAVSDER